MSITIEQPDVVSITIEQPDVVSIELAQQSGIPVGGAEGQFLRKLSDSNYHTGWVSGTSEYYTHNQTTDSSEWIVNHNMGRRPVVAVLSVGGVEVEAEIVHISTNQLRIYFAEAYKGYVMCV